jgi:hypothetical protein
VESQCDFNSSITDRDARRAAKNQWQKDKVSDQEATHVVASAPKKRSAATSVVGPRSERPLVRSNSRPTLHPLFGHGDLASSIVVMFPLLLAYQVAVLFGSPVNGADLVTRVLYVACGRSAAAYLLVHASVAALFLLWMRKVRRQAVLRFEIVAPLLLESAIYGLCLASLLSLVMHHGFGLSLSQTLDRNTLVSAAGAGVHEELIFRCAGIAMLSALLLVAGVPRRSATVLAIIATSIAFAAAHHLGQYGEALSLHAMVYRSLAGVVFAVIYWYRSLGHAVYAHTLYDLSVAWL